MRFLRLGPVIEPPQKKTRTKNPYKKFENVRKCLLKRPPPHLQNANDNWNSTHNSLYTDYTLKIVINKERTIGASISLACCEIL